MNTEDHFLQTIGANPESTGIRFAYADWLEEADDPRGAMIRVEEEMRQLPIYSDRYWELKPQRHAFQDYCKENFLDRWLVQMRYHRRYEPVFTETPDDPHARWRLVREFIERWHGIRLLDANEERAKATELESQLGFTLPASIRQWIALADDLGEDFTKVFRDRLKIQPLRGCNAVSILMLSEGDVCWAIRYDQLKRPDPIVETYYQDAGAGLPRFVASKQIHGSITAFALAHASNFLGQSVSCLLDKDQLAELAEQHGIRKSQVENLSIYECDHAIVFSNGTDTNQIAVWDNRETRDLHPFIAAQM